MGLDFGNLIDIAADASGTLGNTLSAFAELRDLAKAGKLPGDTARDVLALAAGLSEAQTKLARLETEIMKLQRAHEALDRIEQRKRNYVLAETAAGERVYRLKGDAGTGEPSHEMCPACFEQDQMSILQPRGSVLQCDICKSNYRVEQDYAHPQPTRPDRFSGY